MVIDGDTEGKPGRIERMLLPASLPGRFLGGLLLLEAGSGERVVQAVIPLVAGMFEERPTVFCMYSSAVHGLVHVDASSIVNLY